MCKHKINIYNKQELRLHCIYCIVLISALGDTRIKEITSLQRRVILGFLKGRDTFAHLPTGYGKSLI